MAWDGQPGWPRTRAVQNVGDGEERSLPTQYISEFPTDPINCLADRIVECYEKCLCAVCGLALFGDGAPAWLLAGGRYNGCETDAIGAPACTRCAWLSVNACPTLTRGRDSGRLGVWKVLSREGWAWAEADPDDPEVDLGYGKLRYTEQAIESSLDELRDAKVALDG
jgi:hypothetical protein